jgi:multiple sugar transport system permease protein
MKTLVQKILRVIWKNRFAYYFILPTAIAMLLLHLTPITQAFWMSLLKLNQFTLGQYLGAPFIGFQNFYDVMINPQSPIRIGLFEAVRNTVLYTFFVTLGTLWVGLLVALMLNRKFRGRALVRTLFLFPWIVPTYVVGLLWMFMWQRGIGIVNVLLVDVFHLLPTKPFWLIGSNTLWAIIIPTISCS